MSVNFVSLGIIRGRLTGEIVVQMVAGLGEVSTHRDPVLLLLIRDIGSNNCAQIFPSQIFTNNLKYPLWVNVQFIFS